MITDYLTVYVAYLSVLVGASNNKYDAQYAQISGNIILKFYSKECFLTQPKSGLFLKNSRFRYSENHSYYIFYTCHIWKKNLYFFPKKYGYDILNHILCKNL